MYGRAGFVVRGLTVLLCMTACGSSASPAPPAASSSTATSAAPTPPSPSPSPAPSPRSSCPASYATPDPHRPRVSLQFAIGDDHRTVTGHERVVFTPDQSVTELVYRLWPNGRDHRLSGSITVTAATLAGHPVRPQLSSAGGRSGTQGTLLTLPLGRTVLAGSSIESQLDFTLRLPAPFIDRLGSDGSTAWWGTGFPLLAWVRGTGWVRTPAVNTLAEMAVSEAAQTDVSVTAPRSDTVLANGTPSPPVVVSSSRRRWRFESVAARDVLVAVGRFSVATLRVATSAGSVPVRIGTASGLQTPAGLLDQLQRGLPVEVAHFGPYPFSTLTVAVIPGLGGQGIEYPGMFLIGSSAGQSSTIHELTHMWFYGLVGNDQQRHPWLDEAFATFGEEVVNAQLFGHPEFDPNPAGFRDPRPVDSAVSAFANDQSGYDDVVYFKGADALLAARHAAGLGPFDAALRCYVNARAWQVATPADVASAFRKLPAAEAVLRKAGALS